MPPVGLRYTLVGFSADLDWRPLRFLEPIPQNRICRPCGHVTRKTALLPCMHVLCESCHSQCTQDGVLVCPLDRQHCRGRDIDWKECPVDDMLTREVACWNEETGCGAVMAASKIYQHFQHECQHHLASCSKCSARVLRRDICAHLGSECRNLIMPLAYECEAQSSSKDKACLSFFIRSLEERSSKIRAFFERLPVDDSPRGRKILEICQGLNTLREELGTEVGIGMSTVLGELTERVRQSHENSATKGLGRVASSGYMEESSMDDTTEIENLFNAMKTARDALKNVVVNATKHNAQGPVDTVNPLERLSADGRSSHEQALKSTRNEHRLAELCLDSCVFFVNDVQSCEESAMKKGYKFFFIRVVYLRGYCMQPGLRFVKDGDSVGISICFLIRKGYMDEALPWPFRHNIELSFINAVSDAVRAAIFKPISAALQGPAESDKSYIKVEYPSVNLVDLIKDGYVLDYKLLVKWQLLA